MNGSAVSRLISLIPDRVARSQSGSLFNGASSERAALLTRFLGWLGPLNPITREEQQALGVRSGGARPLSDEDGALDEVGPEDGMVETAEEAEESPLRAAEAGTHVAA
jgi:hypothetical protein